MRIFESEYLNFPQLASLKRWIVMFASRLRMPGLRQFGAVCILASAAPIAVAQAPMNLVEKQLFEEMRGLTSPATQFGAELREVQSVEQLVAMWLQLKRCEKREIYGDIARLSNPSYQLLVEETIAKVLNAKKLSARADLPQSDLEVALLAFYRAGDDAAKAETRIAMTQLPREKSFINSRLYEQLAGFEQYGFDPKTGKKWPQWPRWLAEFARRGGLLEALTKKLNEVDSGLGDVFAKRYSNPTTSLTDGAHFPDDGKFATRMERSYPDVQKFFFESYIQESASSTKSPTLTKQVQAMPYLQAIKSSKVSILLHAAGAKEKCTPETLQNERTQSCKTFLDQLDERLKKNEQSALKTLSTSELSELRKIGQEYWDRTNLDAPRVMAIVQQSIQGACELLR